MYKLDLHTHSHCSDGELSPSELVEEAVKAGIDYLALTDHDSIEGIAQAKETAKQHDINIVHGVEISSNHQLATSKKPMSVHIVGLGMTKLDTLNEQLQNIQEDRKTRAIEICKKLKQKLDIDLYTDVLALAHNNPKAITRSHIAKAMEEKNIVTKYQQAFDKYLGQGKPAYVPIDTVSMVEAINMIQKSGGKAVLAHPTKYRLSGMNIRRLIGDFARLGGDAVELPSDKESPATRGLIDRCVELHQLTVSVSSDFHGSHMPWLKLGQVPKKHDNQVGVWEAFIQ